MSDAEDLKLPDLILSLLLRLKTNIGYTTFFAHIVILCNSVIFEFCVTLECLRRHGNLKPKHFDFCIEYKAIYRTFPFHYHSLEIVPLLEEINI